VISRSVVGGLGYRRSTTRLTSRPVHHRLPNRCFSWSDTIRYSFSMTFWVDPSFFSHLSEPTPSPPSLVFVDAILRVSASSYSFHWKWFGPRSHIIRCLSMIIRVSVVLRRTVLTLTEPERVIIRVKGRDSVPGIFLAFRQNFAEIEIKCLHSHTKNAPGTSRGRYHVNFCKESKP